MKTLTKHTSNNIKSISDDVLITPILKELFKEYDSYTQYIEQAEGTVHNTTVVLENDNYKLEFTCSIEFNTYNNTSLFFNIEPTTIFINDDTEVNVSAELIYNLFNA